MDGNNYGSARGKAAGQVGHWRVKGWMRVAAAAATVAALTMSVSACGSSDSTGTAASSSTGAAAPSNSEEHLGKIIEVNCPVTICNQMKNGSEAAAEDLEVDFQWSSPTNLENFTSDYITLLKQAIALKPAALIVQEYLSASRPLVRQAVREGIAVFTIDTGLPWYEEDGALGFSGFSYPDLGESAGKEMLNLGAKNIVCVTLGAEPNTEEECKAVEETAQAGGATVSRMNVNPSESENQRVVAQSFQGYLSSHDEVDGIYSTVGQLAAGIIEGVKDAGRSGEVQIGAANLFTDSLKAIEAGEMAFAVNLNGFLEGYYAVLMAHHYLKYNSLLYAPVLTGGQIVNKSNVGRFLEVNEEFPGVVSNG